MDLFYSYTHGNFFHLSEIFTLLQFAVKEILDCLPGHSYFTCIVFLWCRLRAVCLYQCSLKCRCAHFCGRSTRKPSNGLAELSCSLDPSWIDRGSIDDDMDVQEDPCRC